MDDGLSPLRPDWQAELAQAVSRPAELLALLGLDPTLPVLDYERLKGFPLRVPRGFVAKMRRGDPQDPLFLQVWPSAREADEVPGYTLDAVGDLAKRRDGALIHKYHGRALVIATGACAVHCRYCFRRHYPYAEDAAPRSSWKATLAALRADPSIEEVILSGGDPLALSDRRLADLAEGLAAIPSLRRLRIHTRLPIVLPSRIDAGLLSWLAPLKLQKVVVLHANHANEIDAEVVAACRLLRDADATLLNQSVLLNGVNDTTDALANLSEALFTAGVLPYYLHVLDRVQGAAHFDMDDNQAKALIRELAARLPGYLVPRLAREIAGEPAKTLLPWQ
jgi:EF-P beta-lysylation protein EpmB